MRIRHPSSVASLESPGPGFTLVEMMVAMGVLVLIMGLLFSIINQTSSLWKNTSGKISAFQEARTAFESITRNLSQATLNTYYDYDSPTTPTSYQRQSELQFICGPSSILLTSGTTWSSIQPAVRPTHSLFFQAPLGYLSGTAAPNLNRLLNATGYYIEFNNDTPARPKFLRNRATPPTQYRYRLMRVIQSSDANLIYSPSYAASKGWPIYNGWFNNAVASRQVRPIASNIIALILSPKFSIDDPDDLAPEFRYDSRNNPSVLSPSLYTSETPQTTRKWHKNQLPPMIGVTLVAIDEASASRLAQKYGTAAPPLVNASSFALTRDFSSGDLKKPKDLETLEQALTAQHINYRVFTTNVAIRGAKWSND